LKNPYKRYLIFFLNSRLPGSYSVKKSIRLPDATRTRVAIVDRKGADRYIGLV